MSEYQYYEFQAIDRPLTEQEQAHVRTLSSRVEPTPTQAIFTYSYGDFRGDPLTLLEQSFDAMLYVANWGSKQVAFRFPRALVDLDRLRPYGAAFEEITLTVTEEHVVLTIAFHDEEGLGWIDGEGILSTLIPLRHDILRGDLRAPYLAWLKADQYADETDSEDPDDGIDESDLYVDEVADTADLPPALGRPATPAGLRELSAPLRAFADFFDIDAALITSAAAASTPLIAADDHRVEQQIALLSEAERVAWLVRLARGEPQLDLRLMRRLREVDAGSN